MCVEINVKLRKKLLSTKEDTDITITGFTSLFCSHIFSTDKGHIK